MNAEDFTNNAELCTDIDWALTLLNNASCQCCDGSGAYHDNMGDVRQCQWCDEKSILMEKYWDTNES